MSNDDHLLFPIVNIVPDCQYTEENVTSLSHVAGMGLQDLVNWDNQTEECNSRSPIILCGSGHLQWNLLDRRF